VEEYRDIVVIVDDDITNLTVARNSLSEIFDVITAPSGERMFLLLEKVMPSLILLDVEMPGMNGFEAMKLLKLKEQTKNIPVIFLTAKIDPKTEVEGLNIGAVDYITKPFSRELLAKRVNMHILFERQKRELQKYTLTLKEEVDKKTRTVLELQNAILNTVAELVESRDSVTGGHIERTLHHLGMLVDFLVEHDVYTEELSSWNIDLFVMSSQLHDVGKVSVSDSILMKPGKLTRDEFEQMKKHVIYGVEIIRKIEASTSESEFLHYAESLAGSHHEKWNGEGYPYALKGKEIPLQGRLMAIVDVYDALTNDRPYKKAYTHEKSIEIIRAEKGKHFDPLITEVFLNHEQEFKKEGGGQDI
jgi:putative two-component system response regulator